MAVGRMFSPAALLLVGAAAGAEMDEAACRNLGFVRARKITHGALSLRCRLAELS